MIRYSRFIWTAFALAVALSLMGGCASTGPRDIEGKIATHGLTVAQTVGKLQDAVTTLSRNGAIPDESALKAQQAFKTIAVHGQELAGVLRLIDATSSPAKADIATARDLVSRISEGVIAVTAVLSNSAVAGQVHDLINTLLRSTNTILFELGKV